MGVEALRKSGCFGLILISAIAALINLFRPATRLRDFSIIAGTVGGGYIVFLAVCYLGSSFSEAEIRRAASFYRYSTQAGLLNIALVWMAAPVLLERWARRPAIARIADAGGIRTAASIVAILALPLCLVVAPSVLIALPNDKICALRAEARQVAALAPQGARLAVFEPESDGLFSFVQNFQLGMRETRATAGPRVVWSVTRLNADTMPARMQSLAGADPDVDAVYICRTAGSHMPIEGVDSSAGAALLVRDGASWKKISPEAGQ